MKNKKTIKKIHVPTLFIALALLPWAPASHAAVDSGMTQAIGDQMVRLEAVLESTSGSYELNRFFLNVNPHLGFGVSSTVTLTIQPEIQFYWQKVELGS